jgi:hypothetical protein
MCIHINIDILPYITYMNKKLKISFFNQAVDTTVYKFLLGEDFLEKEGDDRVGTWWVNPAMLYLKMYYDTNSKFSEYIEWNQIYPKMFHEGIADYPKQIIENKTDILCIGLYTWTTQALEEIIKRVKKELPNIIILVGGPEVAVHNEPDWLLERPWIDYCVYGDGQVPLTKLLDCFVQGTKPTKDSITNTAWVDDENGLVVTSNEIFRDKKFFSRGPWWHGRKYVREWTKYARSMGYGIQVNFETSRGCPYNCTFCDWTSGLHNKVSKWTILSTFKDFAFLAQEGVKSFRMSDANFGQWEQDLDIAKFVVKCREKYGKSVLNQCETNWAKMKKDRAFEIMNLWLESGMYSTSIFSYSFQELSPKVLDAIARPEIPWEEHRAYIMKQNKKFPDIRSQAEFIGGLPYQTIESMIYCTQEAYKIGSQPVWYPWQYLANAPVRDENYRKKHDIHVYTWKLPFSVINKKRNEISNFADFQLCWSHAEGIDQAIATFVFKWLQTTIIAGTTFGEHTNFLNRMLTIFEYELYDVSFVQSFSRHAEALIKGKTKDAYIETDEFIINMFHCIDSVSWFNPRVVDDHTLDMQIKSLTEEEKRSRLANLILDRFTPRALTSAAPQIHYAPEV